MGSQDALAFCATMWLNSLGMSMTTHYHFHAPQVESHDANAARKIVEDLHANAGELPFLSVGEIVELKGNAACFIDCPHDDPNLWMLIQAGDMGMRPDFMPRHLIGFQTHPAEGAQEACFGLALYEKQWIPFESEHDDGEEESRQEEEAKNEDEETARGPLDEGNLHKDVWAWNGWCSTQHASNPKFGGWENFLPAYLSVISMLDFAKNRGILSHVEDDYKFWKGRDLTKTTEAVANHQMFSAAFVGALGDTLEGTHSVDSPIKDYPNFERLEFEGRQALEHESQPNDEQD